MKQIMRREKTQLVLMAMLIFLAACGQRGPLYLPDPSQEPIIENEIDENEIDEDEIGEDELGDDPG